MPAEDSVLPKMSNILPSPKGLFTSTVVLRLKWKVGGTAAKMKRVENGTYACITCNLGPLPLVVVALLHLLHLLQQLHHLSNERRHQGRRGGTGGVA